MPDRVPSPEPPGAGEAGEPAVGADEVYRQLFDSHPAPMAIWDPATGRILRANDAAARQYGYGLEDLTGLTVDRIVHPDDLPRLRAQLPNLPSGLAGSESFRHVRRSGEVIEVEMSGHPLTWEGRPARLVMAIDVTARRRLEQELRSARAIEAVGRLAGGIAHDFNNLVMAINGFAELLLERLPEGGDEHDAALEIRSISGPNVRVSIAATATRATIFADRDHVARAIVGCVLNARDAMPDGGDLRIETGDVEPVVARQLVGTIGDRPYVGLAISDNGPTGGAATGGSAIGNRTGLGLALVYSTVQLAGRRIRLESTPGHGSTVRILLPTGGRGAAEGVDGQGRAPAGDATSGPPVADRPEGAADGAPGAIDVSGSIGVAQAQDAGRRESPSVGPNAVAPRPDEPAIDAPSALIAVVEDEPGVRTLVERVLTRGGHRVLAFPDGSAALDALAGPEVPIDLLITDLVMPGPNGIEVARRIRRHRPDLPVVLMSGYAADALRSEGVDESSIELLAKPFTATELLERVATVLGTEAVARG